MLTPPVAARDHLQGSLHAKLVLLEYGDYECPYCGAAYPVVKELQRRLAGKMGFVFRNFPLANAHPHAELAAEAAEAAGAQGKFWEMHDLLYENQEALEAENLLKYASAIGLDLHRFNRDLSEHIFMPRVREDFRSGVHSGVNGTPSFFINGELYNGAYDLHSMYSSLAAVVAA
jgi:protein-disulfide isomerase